MLDWLLGRKVKIVAIVEGEEPGGGGGYSLIRA